MHTEKCTGLKSTAVQILARDVCNQHSLLTYAMTYAYWHKDIAYLKKIFLAIPYSRWDLSSLTRDWTCIPCTGRLNLNPWTMGDVQEVAYFHLSKKFLCVCYRSVTTSNHDSDSPPPPCSVFSIIFYFFVSGFLSVTCLWHPSMLLCSQVTHSILFLSHM